MSMENETTGNGTRLPDGWKMYDKYQLRHTDGTPLKGKRYFVLRLDSDDPAEASRVAAAMAAYKGEQPGNVAALREVVELVANMNVDGYWNGSASICELVGKAKAALAKPARNCDKYATEAEARKAFLGIPCAHPCGDCTVQEGEDALYHECGVKWLFASE